MKKLLAVLLFAVSSAQAGDLSYIWQPNFKIQTVTEACFSLNSSIGDTRACAAIPWIKDQKLSLSIDAGGAFAPGQVPLWLPFGLGYNLTPVIKAGALWALDHAAPNHFPNLKSLLSPSNSSGPDVEMNIGVKWGWIVSNGKAEGQLILSAGPKILFN